MESSPKQVKVTVSLVTWNSVNDLPGFFESLASQTYKDYQVWVIDNCSSDGTIEKIKNSYPEIRFIENDKNIGYAAGHNLAISKSRSDYVLVANADLRLEPGFLEELVRIIDSDSHIGSVGGKLLKMQDPLKIGAEAAIIDTCGIGAYKSRRFVDRGEGEEDKGQYDNIEEVFGVSGALVLYRRSALDDVKIPPGQYFDEEYFMYREDIDLAWRFRQRSWKSFYSPRALAWHRRSTTRQGSDWQILKNRRKKSPLIKSLSYRNHCYTLIKNLPWPDMFWWFPWIFWYELRKFVYLVLFEPRTLLMDFQIVSHLPIMLNRRRLIQKRRTTSLKELRSWFK
ncbi:MAG: glycosyltransferase family 2 protein [Patescibacteria group bacterium]|nr:glycosyltransferase family 2 protein [Patescibacteria group bacterium]